MIKSVSLSGLLCPLFFFSIVCFGSEEGIRSENAPAVTSGSATIKKISNRLTSFGVLETISRPTITAEIPGVIEEIYVEEGEAVQRGQRLAKLGMTDYLIAETLSKNELQKQEQELAKRLDYFARIQTLSETKNVSEDMVVSTSRDIAIDRFSVEIMRNHNEIAARNVAKGKIISPISGVVTKRYVSTGDYLAVSMPIFSIIDDSTLRVRLKISPQDASKITVGQRVTLSSTEFSDEEVSTVIKAIVPVIDPVSNSIDVLAEVNNSTLISGMRVEANIYIREEYEALMVPERAVFSKDGKRYLFVVNDGRIREHQIEVGLREGGWVEIRKGVTNGDVLVFDGYRGMKGGDSVSGVGVAR